MRTKPVTMQTMIDGPAVSPRATPERIYDVSSTTTTGLVEGW
jgi:hypothetical protein